MSILPLLSLFLLHLPILLSQPLSLPALPYDYSALEPVISTATMRSHHLSHHQTYTDNVNRVLTELRSDPTTKPLTKLGLDYILSHIHNASLPLTDSQRRQLRNNGGGYINHELFFNNLAPPLILTDDPTQPLLTNLTQIPDQQPDPNSDLFSLLTSTFSSFSQFQSHFTQSALSVFGSGWSWLILDGWTGELRIESTQAQDSPLMEGKGHVVLLGLDVWEHAYYLDYQSQRRTYVEGWWKVVNWPVVEQRLQEAHKKRRGKKGESSHNELR